MLAGAVMQLLFWVGLFVHQRTAARQLRLDNGDQGPAEPLLGGTGSASHTLSVGTVRSRALWMQARQPLVALLVGGYLTASDDAQHRPGYAVRSKGRADQSRLRQRCK